jgi:hypothetical protein
MIMDEFVRIAIDLVKKAVERPGDTIVVGVVTNDGETMHLSVRLPNPQSLVHLARALLEQAEDRLNDEAVPESEDDALLESVREALDVLPDPNSDDEGDD